MATDWAAISQAVIDFQATHGWWPSPAEYDAIVASLASPAPAPAPSPTPAPAAPAPVSTTAGSGPDRLVLKLSQDYYQGNAQFTVKVDGVQIGGTFTASAWHSTGLSDTITLLGDWTGGVH